MTAGGMNIAPQNIENLLKGDPFISQAMVHGDQRPYPVALLTLNPEELAKFAKLLEKVTVDTIEEGKMTKDLSLLVGPDQKWLSTLGFLDAIDANLKTAMA